jgi:transcriptional regulator with XRE-family HTH domain
MFCRGLVECGMGKEPPRHTETIHLKAWMKACKVKQRQVVEATGYSQGYISNLGRGAKEGPSADFVRKLAVFLGVGMDDLYSLPPAPPILVPLRQFWQQTRQAAGMQDAEPARRRKSGAQ